MKSLSVPYTVHYMLMNTFIRHLGSKDRNTTTKKTTMKKRKGEKKLSVYRVSKIYIAFRNSGIFR